MEDRKKNEQSLRRMDERTDCPGCRKVLNGLKDLIWPRKCILCRRLIGPEGDGVCASCAAALPEPFSGARRGSHYRRWAGALWYEGPARTAFLRFKFGGCRTYGDRFGLWLANAVDRQLGRDFDLMTYVPISSLRRRRRGFDQTLLLAKAAGRALGLEPRRTLKKRSLVKPQSRTLDRAERQRNIRGAFQVIDAEAVRGKRILLIDDVLTTGATVSEAARVLMEAGAKSVDAATLAVTPK